MAAVSGLGFASYRKNISLTTNLVPILSFSNTVIRLSHKKSVILVLKSHSTTFQTEIDMLSYQDLLNSLNI